MVEISKKYKLGIRRFGLINWIGFWTLYKKEVLRFLIVWVQTLLSPIITSLLFLLVLSVALGGGRSDMLGFPFVTFLAPGLIAMQIIQQAFSHSSSSFLSGGGAWRASTLKGCRRRRHAGPILWPHLCPSAPRTVVAIDVAIPKPLCAHTAFEDTDSTGS